MLRKYTDKGILTATSKQEKQVKRKEREENKEKQHKQTKSDSNYASSCSFFTVQAAALSSSELL